MRSRLEDLIVTADRQLASRSFDAAVDTLRTALGEPGAIEAGVEDRLEAARRARDESCGIVRPAPISTPAMAVVVPIAVEPIRGSTGRARARAPIRTASGSRPPPDRGTRHRTVGADVSDRWRTSRCSWCTANFSRSASSVRSIRASRSRGVSAGASASMSKRTSLRGHPLRPGKLRVGRHVVRMLEQVVETGVGEGEPSAAKSAQSADDDGRTLGRGRRFQRCDFEFGGPGGVVSARQPAGKSH